jgi:hypothetical protein
MPTDTQGAGTPTPEGTPRCPRCDSPKPFLHPAVQSEGEVQPCEHPWHLHPRDVGHSCHSECREAPRPPEPDTPSAEPHGGHKPGCVYYAEGEPRLPYASCSCARSAELGVDALAKAEEALRKFEAGIDEEESDVQARARLVVRVALALEAAGAKHIDFFCAANQARISALEVALRASEAEVESLRKERDEQISLAESWEQEYNLERLRGVEARQEGARIEGENLRAVLKRSKELRNLGFNEALAPKRGRDSTGVTAAEYARAADEVEQAIDAALRGGSPQSSPEPEKEPR